MLRELLERTDLAVVLGLWSNPEPPTVLYEPFGGLFDLALPRDVPRILIELKVGADLGDNQRARQRERAGALLAQRVYILLGPSFFMALDEPDARNIGAPELAGAIRSLVGIEDTAVRELADAYVLRLEADAAGWGEHDARSTSGLDLFRLYAEMAARLAGHRPADQGHSPWRSRLDHQPECLDDQCDARLGRCQVLLGDGQRSDAL